MHAVEAARGERRPCAIAEPLRAADHDPERFLRRLDHARIAVGILALGEQQPERIEPLGREPLRNRFRGAIPGLIPVERDQHALGTTGFERSQELIGHAMHAVAARDIAIAGVPERQRIEQRLAQDHFLCALDAFTIQHATVRSRQIQVLRCAGAQVIEHFPAIRAHNMAITGFIRLEQRDDDRAVQVLMARVTQDAHALQGSARFRAGLVLLRGEPISERAIRIAQPEPLDQLHVAKASTVEVLQRLRARLQRLVVKLDHLIEQRLVAGFQSERLRRAQLAGR